MKPKMIYGPLQFETDTRQLADRLVAECDSIHAVFGSVFGVPSGGVPLATALGLRLRLPLVNADAVDERTLVVDDIADTGKTLEMYPNNMKAVLHLKPAAATKFCDSIRGAHLIDQDQWVQYFWEPQERAIEDHVTRMLQYIGEDPTREGLKETPARIVKSWSHFYSGYGKKAEDILKTFEDGACDEMVILDNIEFYSTCEHHMVPFVGRAHVAYIPNGKVVGISKLARLVEIFARRMQIQERIGSQVTAALMEHLGCKGAACVIEAQHLCMTARGVEKQNSVMKTSSLEGVFKTNPQARMEFLMHLQRSSR